MHTGKSIIVGLTDKRQAGGHGQKGGPIGTCQNLSFYFLLYCEGSPSAKDS